MSSKDATISIIHKFNAIMPTGAGVLFLIQIFATLAFSVFYSTLVLYITSALKLSDSIATAITATFVAFHYALPLIAGYIGGRHMSYRMLFSVGLIAQFIGCVMLSLETIQTFYWALAIFLLGSCFNITCINCMLTQLFKPEDKRREAAFLWNYSGMNIGFFIGFSISGYFQLVQNYSLLFLLSSLGSIISLLITMIKWRTLSDIKTTYNALPVLQKYHANFKSLAIIIALFFALRLAFLHATLSNELILTVGVIMVCVITGFSLRQRLKNNRDRIAAYLILAFASLVFWSLYQLAPMGLTLFIARNVDLHYFGITIAPQWVQNINTVIIIIGGPILSILFTQLRARGFQITIPVQFSFALIMIGIAFCLLPIGIYFADKQGYTSFHWVLASYIVQSIGELFIAPIGYAMIGQLAPINLQGIMMGTWVMIIGVAATLSAYFSGLALGNTTSFNPLVTNHGYSDTFGFLGVAAIIAGLLLFICVPLIQRLTHEKKLVAREQVVNPIGI